MSSVLAGKYEVLERLAVGGMAEVFLARVRGPAEFERRLVIKRVLPALAAEPEFTRLFELEARYAALIEHPHVAQVFDFGHDAEGRPWLAMEYVDGASVRALLRAGAKRGEAADVRLVAHVFARAAEGLAAAHDLVDPQTRAPLHLVHRDVSPDNVLVSRLGAVKVSDFGIARATVKAGTTRPDQMRGKLNYLSPEQLIGEPPTAAVDVWALGVCLFEALAGQRPFPEENEGQTVNAIISGLRPVLTDLRPGCPKPLVEVVDACLAVDPAQRMPDCHEVALALGRFLSSSGGPITTAMVGAWVDRLSPPRPAAPPEPARLLPELGTPAPEGDARKQHRWDPGERAPARERSPTPRSPREPDDFVPTSALSARVAAMEPSAGDPLAPDAARVAAKEPSAGDPSAPDAARMLGGAPPREPTTPHGGTGRDAAQAQPATPHGAARREATPARHDTRGHAGARPSDGAGDARAPRASEAIPVTDAPAARGRGRWLFAVAAVVVLGGVGAWRWRVTHPPEPEPARVVVTSTPSGARVRVDGQEVGKTPWAGDHRGAAPFEVEVSAPGYAPYRQTLPPGEASSVSATLHRKR